VGWCAAVFEAFVHRTKTHDGRGMKDYVRNHAAVQQKVRRLMGMAAGLRHRERTRNNTVPRKWRRNVSIKAKSTDPVATTAAAASKGFDQTVAGLKDGMTTAAKGFEETQAKVKAGMEKAVKTAEELVTFSQGNMEAFVKSGQIWSAGLQDLSKHVAASAQASLDETIATFKAFSSVKSLKDAMDLQSSLARSSLEKAVAESSKLTDASVKLAEKAFAPISARYTLAIEKFAKTA
jgi:phasin family protein